MVLEEEDDDDEDKEVGNFNAKFCFVPKSKGFNCEISSIQSKMRYKFKFKFNSMCIFITKIHKKPTHIA